MRMKMSTEKELQNKVNPVGNTAVTTLALKAAAGLKRAGEVYMRLGFANAPKSDDGPDDLTKLCFVAIHDMRHEAVDRMIMEAGLMLTGVNTGVREILVTTGFIEFFEIA